MQHAVEVARLTTNRHHVLDKRVRFIQSNRTSGSITSHVKGAFTNTPLSADQINTLTSSYLQCENILQYTVIKGVDMRVQIQVRHCRNTEAKAPLRHCRNTEEEYYEWHMLGSEYCGERHRYSITTDLGQI